jgi:histidinol-phosphate aminotransferase
MNVRVHLESLPPYTPIEPFEVLSARLGRDPARIVKLDANENPYGLLPAVAAPGRWNFRISTLTRRPRLRSLSNSRAFRRQPLAGRRTS